MKTETELKRHLDDLIMLETLRDRGVVNLTVSQDIRRKREIEFLKEILE